MCQTYQTALVLQDVLSQMHYVSEVKKIINYCSIYSSFGAVVVVCNQWLSPLTLRVWIPLRARCTTLCDKVCQWLVAGRWY